jgi:hypothetical protein
MLKRDLEEVGFLRFISDLAVLTSFVGGANPRPAAARLTAERRNTGHFTGSAVAGDSSVPPAFPPAALFTHAVATPPAAPSPPTWQVETIIRLSDSPARSEHLRRPWGLLFRWLTDCVSWDDGSCSWRFNGCVESIVGHVILVLIEYTLDMPTEQISPVSAKAGCDPSHPRRGRTTRIRRIPEQAILWPLPFAGEILQGRVRPLWQDGADLR